MIVQLGLTLIYFLVLITIYLVQQKVFGTMVPYSLPIYSSQVITNVCSTF
jgi:hypothetical protein